MYKFTVTYNDKRGNVKTASIMADDDKSAMIELWMSVKDCDKPISAYRMS